MTTYDANKYNLVYSMFNQYMFSEAKMNIIQIKKYYVRDPLTNNNEAIHSLLNLIKDKEISEITRSSVELVCSEAGSTDTEVLKIADSIFAIKHYTRDQVLDFKNSMKKICFRVACEDAEKQFSDDPVKFTEAIRSYEYKSNHDDIMTVKTLGELDITDMMEDYLGNGLRSSQDFINNSFPIGGYIGSQLVMVVGAPGAGKSLFLMEEALSFLDQGKRVHYLAMGDLSELDMIIRMSAMKFKIPLTEVSMNIPAYKEKLEQTYGDLLKITCLPSSTLTPKQYRDYMMDNLEMFDVALVDYDSNFKTEGEQMYKEGGVIYDFLTEVTRQSKRIFVAAQPKQAYWNSEFLPLDSAGESSRKQHIVDMIITIGKNPNAKLRLGNISIVKNRRGVTDLSHRFIGANSGNLVTCSEINYSGLKTTTNKRSLSVADIQLLQDEADKVEASVHVG